MPSRKRAKLLRDREEGVARVQRQLDNGQLVVDRAAINPYEDGWTEVVRPPRPIYVTPPAESRLLLAGTFAKDAPTAEQRRRGQPHSPHRAVGSPVWIRWEPQTLEADTWRYVDGKAETVAQSDVNLGGNNVQELHANVQFQARSAIAAADRQFARSMAQYEMRLEIYRAAGNDGDPGEPIVPNDGHEEEDEELYGRPEDGLYDEWLGQLEEEGIDPNEIA